MNANAEIANDAEVADTARALVCCVARRCLVPPVWHGSGPCCLWTIPEEPSRMSERNKPHNGRDMSGHFKVKQTDVEDLITEPDGEEIIRDDVKLGGAVEDTGVAAAERARRIHDLVEQNRADVEKLTEE